jgi:hypothetical protein
MTTACVAKPALPLGAIAQKTPLPCQKTRQPCRKQPPPLLKKDTNTYLAIQKRKGKQKVMGINRKDLVRIFHIKSRGRPECGTGGRRNAGCMVALF